MTSAGWFRKLKLYVSMMRYGLAHHRDFAREHWAFFQTLRESLPSVVGRDGVRGLRVLDLGCGKMMWLTLLLHSAGARVTGIDTEWTDPKPSLSKYWGIWKQNGLERTLRTLVWDLLYAGSYYKALAREASFPLEFDGIDARAMRAEALNFEDDTFDLAVSHEVFEHLPDVEGAIRELRRVIKPNGVTYIYTHNFTSISGGHHIAWKYPDTEPSSTVPPWDHLRDRRFPDIPSWINGWRMDRYRQTWNQCFDILEWRLTEREGEKLLTDDIRAELSDYAEEELLTKGFIVVAKPKKSKDFKI